MLCTYRTTGAGTREASEASPGAAITLLPAGGFYNRHFGGHLLAFFHASDDDQAAMCHQQAAMIHGGVGSVLAQCFPRSGMDVKSESHRGGLGRLAIIADPIVVVRVIAAA